MSRAPHAAHGGVRPSAPRVRPSDSASTGSTATAWRSGPTVRHDEQFQIRLYRASDTFVGGAKYRFKQTGADQIVANIWNWDPSWTVNVYENDVLSGQMTRNSDIDAWTVAYHIGLLNNTDSYRKSSDHMFHYTLKNPAAAVRVEAIDRNGNKYEQTVFTDPAEHPGDFHADF